eukprot:Colp12_sorted_trinity150504_noHs@600
MPSRVLHWSYEQIHNLVAEISEKIAEFRPDVMVAIGGGGFIPARILRTYVKVPILAVGIELYDPETKMAREAPVKTQWIDKEMARSLKNKRILVVDEVDDSRATLSFCVKEILQECEPDSLGVFVLHNKLKPKKAKLPDSVSYFVGQECEDYWFVYPWDARNIYEHQAIANARTRVESTGE